MEIDPVELNLTLVLRMKMKLGWVNPQEQITTLTWVWIKLGYNWPVCRRPDPWWRLCALVSSRAEWCLSHRPRATTASAYTTRQTSEKNYKVLMCSQLNFKSLHVKKSHLFQNCIRKCIHFLIPKQNISKKNWFQKKTDRCKI